MRKLKQVSLLLFLALCLMVSACETQPSPSPSSPTEPQPETATYAPPELSAPTRTPSPTAVPTLTLTRVETAVPLEEQIACGEVFCQVEWQGMLIRPISSDFRNTIDLIYPYGSTKGGTLEVHHGVEFPNPAGTPVRASAEGDVLFAGDDSLTLLGPYTSFYGSVVILHHPDFFQGRDLFTLYAHLSEIYVEEGAHISAGDVLGLVGSSGAADGAHLHFEVRIDENDYDQALNPVLWFEPATTSGDSQTAFLAGQIVDPYGMALHEFDFVLAKLQEDTAGVNRYYPMTYVGYDVNAHPLLEENFVMPDIPPGEYKLAFVAGKLYEFTFTLSPGRLGFIEIQLD